MTQLTEITRRNRIYSFAELAIIILLALVPLFNTFPYRVNIFLSWEGAYRLSEGQIPYRDFGMPVGYMYWVIPAIFFKIFGAQMFTLVKAQVFINIISGLAFRSILKSISVQPGIRLLSVLLYCISYSFFNFWPWYNHTVIVYEMIGLAFLMFYLFRNSHWIWLSISALFLFFSFFTKQDGGGLAFILCLVLLAYHCFHHKNWKPLLIFTGSFALVAFAIIAPLTRYNFGYWFNHGQPPHTSRFSFREVLDEFFMGSQWIKFYLLVIILLAAASFPKWRSFFSDKRNTVFLLLTLGILAEAVIFGVTSYTPPDNNIFYHSFAFAYIISRLSELLSLDLNKSRPLLAVMFGLLLWWSSVFWKYLQRVMERVMPVAEARQGGSENIVNRRTFMINRDTTEIPMSEWRFTQLPSFNKIYMPGPTVDGIGRLMRLEEVKKGKAMKMLNLTELTPLIREIGYQAEKGPEVPLWHHLGVSMFNREAKQYEQKIAAKEYDLVLFEYIPNLNNFYPFRIRDSLKVHYQIIDSFAAPRRGDTKGFIEVYRR